MQQIRMTSKASYDLKTTACITTANSMTTYQATCRTGQTTHLEHCLYAPLTCVHTHQFHSPTPVINAQPLLHTS